MTGIEVLTSEPTNEGRLYPRYDADAGILVIESEHRRPWPFGVDVDGRLILDADEHGVIANCDVHIGRRRWSSVAALPWPSTATERDVVLHRSAMTRRSFSMDVRVQAEQMGQTVAVLIGHGHVDYYVRLSDRVVAMIGSECLLGFMTRV